MPRKKQAVEEVEAPEPEELEQEVEALEEEPEESEVPYLDVDRIQREIEKELKFATFEPDETFWLDTRSPDMNSVLGSRELGMPYGKLTELRGKNHGGKTALALILAGMAQRDGAGVGYIDLENSRDTQWSTKLGLDVSRVIDIHPKFIYSDKKRTGIPRLQSAEELFSATEVAMRKLSDAGFKKQFWMLDSIANLQTQMVVEGGATGQNMRTKGDRAAFLSLQLPHLCGLAANYNAQVVLINQIRTKIGFVLGDPNYSPGGNALEHSCHVRINVRRLKNGQLRKNGKIVGLVGVMKNFKNKAGHGSQQDEEVGFKIRWDGQVVKFEVMSKDEAEELLKEDKGE